MRLGTVALLVLLLAQPAAAQAEEGWAGSAPESQHFFEGARRALDNVTDSLHRARLGLPAREAADEAGRIVEVLAATAGLPAEREVRLAASRQAETARALVASHGLLRDELGRTPPDGPISSERAHALLARLAALERDAEAMEAEGHDASALLDNSTRLARGVRERVEEKALLLLPAGKAFLGGGFALRVLSVAPEPPIRVEAALDGLPPIPARPEGAAEAEVVLPIPFSVDALGPRVFTAEATYADGTRLTARVEVEVGRHPTRIVVGAGPALESALPPGTLVPSEAAALREALRAAEGDVVLLDRSGFDGGPAYRFPGNALLAPSESAPPAAGPSGGAFTFTTLRAPVLLLALLALVAAGAWGIRRRTRRGDGSGSAPAEAAPPSAPAPSPVRAVDVEADPEAPPETRVQEAYRLVRERALGSGLADPFLTPRELADELSRKAGRRIDPLVRAYERARFSTRPLSQEEAREAVAAARHALEALP